MRVEGGATRSGPMKGFEATLDEERQPLSSASAARAQAAARFAFG